MGQFTGIRRQIALLGVLAILFQVLLVGWHHHALALASHRASSVAGPAKAAPLSPATAEDSCEICAALHHLSAAPGEPIAVATPTFPAAAVHLPGTVLSAPALERGFQARAPPSA